METNLQVKSSTTLQGLMDRVSAYAADCEDYEAVNSREIAFAADNRVDFIQKQSLLNLPVAGSGRLNDWAFSQIAGRLAAPGRWLMSKDCPEDLKITILNDLAQKYRESQDLFVRVKGETIRAILSSSYTRFDNLEFLELVAQAIGTMGIEPKIHRAYNADELKAYVLFPQVEIAKDPGSRDPGDGGLHPALYIGNSERGGGSARVTGAVFRTICSNGLIMGYKEGEAFETRHRFHSRAIMANLVAEGIATGLRLSTEATAKFIQSQEVKIPAVNLRSIVEDWSRSYGISIDAKDNWLAAVTAEASSYGRNDEPRLFDLVNGATYIAQTRGLEECELMERMAGDLLDRKIRHIDTAPVQLEM